MTVPVIDGIDMHTWEYRSVYGSADKHFRFASGTFFSLSLKNLVFIILWTFSPVISLCLQGYTFIYVRISIDFFLKKIA